MAKPIPQDDTPVSRRERQNREIRQSDEVAKSRKAMEALLSVNKKISKTLENSERVTKTVLDGVSKKLGDDGSKMSKVVRGASSAIKIIGDSEMALKAWRAKSASATKKFETEQAKLLSQQKKTAKELETAKEKGDKDAIGRLTEVLGETAEKLNTLQADRTKTTGYMKDQSGFDGIKKGITESIGGIRNTFDELLGDRAKPTKSKPAYVKLDPTDVAKSEKKADDRAKKSDEKADKRSKKLADVTEKSEEKRESRRNKQAVAKEKKVEEVTKAKTRKQIDAQNEIDKATQANIEQTETAREEKRIKRDVSKSDLKNVADRLERSFASRFGDDDSGLDLDFDDRDSKKRKGKGKRGKGKLPKGRPNVPKPTNTPKPSGGALSRGLNVAKNVGTKAGGTIVRGAVTAGKVLSGAATSTAGVVMGSAIAGLTAGTMLAESGALDGIMGANYSSQYTIGDLMSDWFGDGTRNLERALEKEKKKVLDRADKIFKDFSTGGGSPWSGVSDSRLKEMKSPTMASFVSRYYQLWMQENEWSATSNILTNHRDSDKIPADKKADADSRWKQAVQARIKYKKDYIEKVPSLSAGETTNKTLQDARQANQKADNDAEAKAKQNQSAINQSSATASIIPPTKSNSPTIKPSSSGATGGYQTNQQVTMGASSGSGAMGNSSSSSGMARGKQTKQATQSNVGGESLEDLEKFLMSAFIPALATAIADKIGGGAQQTQQKRSQQGKKPNQYSPSVPVVYK